MSRFDLTNYETVAHRIARFHGDHGDGAIITDLHHVERVDGRPVQYIVRASVFVGGTLRSTGWAEEIVGTSPVNKTSALENAETSAVGRALANLNYAPTDRRPSREEMEKVQRHSAPGTPR